MIIKFDRSVGLAVITIFSEMDVEELSARLKSEVKKPSKIKNSHSCL